MEKNHSQDDHADRRRPTQARLPLDARPGQSVQEVEPHGKDRRDDVRPVGDGAQLRILQPDILELENVDARQQQPRDEHDEAGGEEQVADFHRATVRAIVRIFDVEDAEDDNRQDEHKSQREVREEHGLVKIVLESDPTSPIEPLQKRNAGQVNRVRAHQRDQPEDEAEQNAQPRPHRAHVLLPWRRAARRNVICRRGHDLRKVNGSTVNESIVFDTRPLQKVVGMNRGKFGAIGLDFVANFQRTATWGRRLGCLSSLEAGGSCSTRIRPERRAGDTGGAGVGAQRLPPRRDRPQR